MSLLFFTYSLAVFLMIFSYYLDSHTDKNGSIFTGITMNAAFIALTMGLGINLLYVANPMLGGVAFKVGLSCIALFSITLLQYAFMVPYFSKNRVVSVLIFLLFAFGVYLVFGGNISVSWQGASGFTFYSDVVFGTMKGLSLYTIIFLYGLPGLSILVVFFRALGLQSRIYRQQLLLVSVSMIVGLGVSFFLFRLSISYYWILPLTPFGLAVMIVLVFQSSTITTLLDKALIAANMISFTVLGLLFSLVAALMSMIVVSVIPSKLIASIILVFVAILLLYFRESVAHLLGRFVRIGSEYEFELEAGLDLLDYTSGGTEVVNKTVALLGEYVECAYVDILVSDDKGKLITVFSSTGAKNEISSENKAIDFILGRNESIVLKTQAITKHAYAEYKADLLKIFDVTRADAMMILREGHRIVGLILLGPKKRGSDYTDYDYTVLAKLYSNFFLVMYYLKNIANESVVLTVDREIEYSGQIITSIQENIDRIDHPKVDVDFITKSARKLGGDFIDFIKLGEEKYLFVMGDVSGKGLNASMSMVILKSVLRTFLSETGDFKQLVVKVNLFIKNNLPKGTFFAGVFGLMDFETNVMYYINCGVPAMFLYTAAYNNAIEIQGDGKILGFVKDIGKYLKVKKIVLNPQDIILMTTDGLVDSTNLRGERFGKDRVQRMLLDNRSYPAGRMAQFLCDNLSDFVSRELEDDISVLVFKFLSK